VVSVGAIGPGGPAPFTNWGPWVRACAPGVGVVSSFFDWDGTTVAPPGVKDAEKFSGWAEWSGTSFSAPVVVGALAHEMVARKLTVAQAVERLIDAPGLTRIPYLGTVVNVL
jgi:subtilisin family serine protease